MGLVKKNVIPPVTLELTEDMALVRKNVMPAMKLPFILNGSIRIAIIYTDLYIRADGQKFLWGRRETLPEYHYLFKGVYLIP